MFMDDYPTPPWVVRRALEKMTFLPTGGTYLDPCAGNGDLLLTLKDNFPAIKTSAMEIQKKYEAVLSSRVNESRIGDFLATPFVPKNVDIVFTNPPFKYALEFIKKSLEISDTVVMLLRLNFLGSQRRHSFLSTYVPDVYILPNRPSFRANSMTDVCEYAWYHFSSKPKNEGKLIMLDSTSKKERT